MKYCLIFTFYGFKLLHHGIQGLQDFDPNPEMNAKALWNRVTFSLSWLNFSWDLDGRVFVFEDNLMFEQA